jgi:hypothetical protein
VVHEFAEILGQPAATAARFLGRHLHGDSIEARVVTLGVASNQRLELICLGHGVDL